MKFFYILFWFYWVGLQTTGYSYTLFTENGKVGVKTEDGKVLIPAQYEEVGWSNGSFSVLNNVTGYRQNGLWGLINLNNQRVTKGEYETLYPSSELLVASKNEVTSSRRVKGCITTSGKVIIPFQYDGISIHALRAVVFTKIGNQFKYGLVDLQNKTLIPSQYQEIYPIGSLRYAVRNFDGKTAVFSENGQAITGFVIDSLSNYKSNYALVYQGKNVGLIDRDGAIKVESKYREIDLNEGKSIKVREADEWFLLSSNNSVTRKVNYDSIVVSGPGLLKVRTGNHAELMDGNLNPIGNAMLSDIGKFTRNRALYRIGDLSGILLSDGRIVLPAMYHEVMSGKGYIIANQRQGAKNNWILFDSAAIRVTSRTYDMMRPLIPGYFAVKNKGFWGVLNSTGKEVVTCAYDSILEVRDNLLAVKFKGLYGIISLKEEWIASPKTNRLAVVNAHRYLEYAPNSTFLKEMNGTVIYFSGNRLEIAADHLTEYLSNGGTWDVDFNGLIMNRQNIPQEPIERIYEESEGYRAIKKNGRYGFIDSRGRLRIANRYEDVKPFKEGYAAVKILGKWGFINLQDNIAVQPAYDEVFSFELGFARVRQRNLFGLIDKGGKVVLPLRYESISVLPSKNLLIKLNGLSGLADPDGKILIQPRFDFISDLNNGFAVVAKDKKFGLVNYNGVSTIPLMYDHLTFDPSTGNYIAMKKSAWKVVTLQ